MYGRERRRVQAAIVEDHLPRPIDDERTVEVAPRPFGRCLEQIPGNEDAAATGELLQALGQRAGNGGAGSLDPIANAHLQRRALHAEFGKHDQIGLLFGLAGPLDQTGQSVNIPLYQHLGCCVVRCLCGTFAQHLDAGCTPWPHHFLLIARQWYTISIPKMSTLFKWLSPVCLWHSICALQVESTRPRQRQGISSGYPANLFKPNRIGSSRNMTA